MAKPFANSIRNSLPNILVIILLLWLVILKYCLEFNLEKPIYINCIISSWSSSKHQKQLHLQTQCTQHLNHIHTQFISYTRSQSQWYNLNITRYHTSWIIYTLSMNYAIHTTTQLFFQNHFVSSGSHSGSHHNTRRPLKGLTFFWLHSS